MLLLLLGGDKYICEAQYKHSHKYLEVLDIEVICRLVKTQQFCNPLCLGKLEDIIGVPGTA